MNALLKYGFLEISQGLRSPVPSFLGFSKMGISLFSRSGVAESGGRVDRSASINSIGPAQTTSRFSGYKTSCGCKTS